MAFEGPYPQPSEQAIASFPFVDIASGLGYEKFWLVGTGTESAVGRILTNLTLVSSIQMFPVATQTTFTADDEEITWDTSIFNLPRTVRGDLLVQSISKAGATAGNFLNYKLFKVNASGSETDISSGGVRGPDIDQTAEVPDLTVVPLNQTTIKKGEKLRLKITSTIGASNITLVHDGSESFILIPFRIDL